jgi:phage recombination protein Bet
MADVETGSKPAPHRKLIERFAERYYIDPDKLLVILKATAFKQKEGEVSNEQMAALLVVADQYGLNPFTREIFAFPDKQNGIVPVVGVDGWSRIINDHPQSDGFKFRQSEKMTTPPDGKECPEWMEVIIYRKDRSRPIVVREYIDEVYRPLGTYPDGNRHKPGPWQTHTKRFFRHKTLIQGGRIAYGFSGIFDDDEAERIIEGQSVRVPEDATGNRSGTSRLKAMMDANRPALGVDPGEHLEQERVRREQDRAREPVTVDAGISPSGTNPGATAFWAPKQKAPAASVPADEQTRAMQKVDWVLGLEAVKNEPALEDYANRAPEFVRADTAFGRAFKKRQDELRGKDNG